MQKYYIECSYINDVELDENTGVVEFVEKPIYYVYEAKTHSPVCSFQYLWQAQNYCEIKDKGKRYN